MNKKQKKVLAIVIGFVMGVFMTWYGATELVNSKRLAARGKSTVAQVADNRERVSGRLHIHYYYLTVDFRADTGRSIHKEVEVNEKTYEAGRSDGSIKVYYLAEEPTICAAGEKVELRYGHLLFGLFLIGGALYLLMFFKQPADTEEALESMEERLKPLTLSRHQYATVQASQFKHLDLEFYEQGRKFLEDYGFSHLADQEDLSLRHNGFARTFIRILLSRDHTTIGSLYHCKPGWMLRAISVKDVKNLCLETMFSNGNWICTSNAEAAGKLSYPAVFNNLFLPSATPLAAILEAHERRTRDFLESNPGVEGVTLAGLEDVRRVEDEQQRIKAEFRRGVGGFSKAELERIAGKQGPEVDKLHEEFAKRHPSKLMQAVEQK